MVRGLIEALVARMLAERVDYLAAYPSKVVEQTADGTLSLRPDTDRLPAMTGIPIRYGIPGVTAKVTPGARVILTFEAGDPSRPIATVWESASVTELTITATTTINVNAPDVRLAGGSRGVVMAGDPVVVMIGPVELAKIAAGSAPITLPGMILTGSRKVKGA